MSIIQEVGFYLQHKKTMNQHDVLREQERLAFENEVLQENMLRLERDLEEAGWSRINEMGERALSRRSIEQIAGMARAMYLKNPLIRRGVDVKKYYVWGQGVHAGSEDEELNAVLQAYWAHEENKKALTGNAAQMMREQELETDGNLFFVFFPDPVSGEVLTRNVALFEIKDVILNPEDRYDPWFYLREYTVRALDGTMKTRKVYHPDWKYVPVNKRDKLNGIDVMWDAPIFHVKVGGFGDWRWGVSETYPALDWARAYKEFLENWSTIVKAYARFAWKVKTKGGKRGIATAKAKLNTTRGTGGERNPAPVTGSSFIHDDGNDLQPIRTAGATTAAEDGRRLLLMVAATFGYPETFFGDVSVGTLATAKSLNRPTELGFIERQTFWKDVIQAIQGYVLLWQVKAPGGALHSKGRYERKVERQIGQTIQEGRIRESVSWVEDVPQPVSTVDFPPLLASDKAQDIQAILSAATLDGKQLAGTIPDKVLVKQLLTALGEDDVAKMVEELFGDAETLDELDGDDDEMKVQVPEEVEEALREFMAVVESVRGGVDA